MGKQKFLLAILSAVSSYAFAQSTYHFTSRLYVASGSRYGREAIYTDLLAYKLYNNSLAKPTDSGLLDITSKGDSLIWRQVKADSANRFAIRRWEAIISGNTFGNPNRVDRGTGYLYLTYTSSKTTAALLHIKGNSGAYVNGVPHMGDPYSAGYMYLPVKLKKGLNEFYVRGTNITADLIFPSKLLSFNTEDLTLPMIVQGEQNNDLKAALVIINTSDKSYNGLQVKATVAGKEIITTVPDIFSMTTRKVPFSIDGSAITEKGSYTVMLSCFLMEKQWTPQVSK